MDITAIFKTCVETLRQRNKELAFMNPNGEPQPSSSKPKIFPAKKQEYSSKAKELSNTITSLRDYLHENKNAYLNIAGSSANTSIFSLSSSSSSSFTPKEAHPPLFMTDVDRDILDNDVQKIIHSCQSRILEFEKVIENTEAIFSQPHLRTHLENVAESLTTYLKAVTVLFSEMRAVRVKRTVDYQNMARITSPASSNKTQFGKSSRSEASSSSIPFGFLSKIANSSEAETKSARTSENEDAPPVRKQVPTVPDYFQEDGDIPPEELQLLEEENIALLNQLNSRAQEVDQIQSSVVQIAQLQEIFTEKVLQQEKEIDMIADVIVGTTENIKGGNEQIRQAIQHNADFRVWVLFVILVMSFSLLFLDWYND